MLCGFGDGRKAKPTIIFKGKGTRTKVNIPGANVLFSDSGWITEDLAVLWLRMTLTRFVDLFSTDDF